MKLLSNITTAEPASDLMARALAAANAKAREQGVDPEHSRVSITRDDRPDHEDWLRIHYGVLDYVKRRGGGLLVFVEESTSQVGDVLRTQ